MVILQAIPIDVSWIPPAIATIIVGIIGWSLSRNIKENDDRVTELTKKLENILDRFDKLKDDTQTSGNITNGKISEIKDIFVRELNQIAIKIEQIKRNDAK